MGTPDEVRQAEQATLGALILQPRLLADVDLTGEDWAAPPHPTIWATLQALRPLGPEAIDIVTVAAALAARGDLARIGGATYLTDLTTACPDPSHLPHYLKIIHRHTRTRGLHQLAARLNQLADQDDDTRHLPLTIALTELAHIADGTRNHLNGRHPHLTPTSAQRIRPVKWLWHNRIPNGTLTLISGREGVGKSIYLAWLAAAITNGNLPGMWHGQPRGVLYHAREDSWEHTITPRLLAAGANLDLVYRLDMTTPDGRTDGLSIPKDLDHIAAAAEQADAAVLLCDPLLSILDDTINPFKAAEVRSALEPLTHMADRTRIAIIGLTHYNKTRHNDALSMIANTRAFVEVARAVLAIARDDEADEYTCILTQGKNNLGTLDLPNLAYTIDSVTIETDEGEDTHVGRLRWTDDDAEITADEILIGVPGTRSLSENSQRIIEWVETQPGTVTVAEVAEHMKDAMNYEAVKKTLQRLSRTGRLVSRARGTYQGQQAKAGKKRPTAPKSQTDVSIKDEGHTLKNTVPSVPNSPNTYINPGREREGGERTLEKVVSQGTEECPEGEQDQKSGLDQKEDPGTRGTGGTHGRGVGGSPREDDLHISPTLVSEDTDSDAPEEWWKR
jgi:archaellum biogenesis ATPase FlaH